MSEKRITVVLYGCDRNIWRGGPLDLRISDIFARGGPRLLYEGRSETATMELQLDLPFDAGQVYGLTFAAPDHRPAWQLVRRLDFMRSREQVEGDDAVLRLMLLPDKPGTTDLAGAFDRLQQAGSPFADAASGIAAEAYQALEDPAKMAFLNIEAKLRETSIDGLPLMSFVRGVSQVAVDRVFVLFDPGLKARMPRATEFAGAPGHDAPRRFPELPDHPDSWKHVRFAEGNIQLSFSKDAAAAPRVPSLVHSADVDIDLGRGLAHAREWLENNVFRPGHKTNQALVYGQLYAQGILPQYVLDPVLTMQRAAPTLTLRRVSPKRRRPAVRAASPRRPRRRPVRSRAKRKTSSS
jgi:hypothetical protein